MPDEDAARPFRPWVQAWQDALYGPDGFYRRAEGPAGHFATSAQGIPGVDAILARGVLALADSFGVETVLDFACGRGEFLAALQAAGPSMRLLGCDVVERPDGLDERIGWLASPGGGRVPRLDALAEQRVLVMAHEWLDVVPCEIYEVDDDGLVREVLVAPDGRERLAATPTQLPGVEADAGTRIELPRSRDEAWRALVAEVRAHAAPGSVVLGIDYAMWRDDAPPLGTLTGFRDGVECLARPDGSCDITSHVILDDLDLTGPPRTQRDTLTDLFGPQAGAPVPIDLARTDPPAYLARLAARSAFTTATARGGLGDFAWFLKVV